MLSIGDKICKILKIKYLQVFCEVTTICTLQTLL
jgi:hypothetical protein